MGEKEDLQAKNVILVTFIFTNVATFTIVLYFLMFFKLLFSVLSFQPGRLPLAFFIVQV